MTDKKATFLPSELQEELDTLERYWLRYRRVYNRVKAEIEEKQILLRFKRVSQSDTWSLNDALYQYAEASISSLEWLKPQFECLNESRKRFPFTHQILREWRNINHHDRVLDFQLYELRIGKSGEETIIPPDWHIVATIFRSKRLEKLITEHFGTSNFVTDATLADLVEAHDKLMLTAFRDRERSILTKMPPSYLRTVDMHFRTWSTGQLFVSKEAFFSSENPK